MLPPLPTIHRYHEIAWLIQFNTGFDPRSNRSVHALARQFLLSSYTFHQIIPAYDSLYLEFTELSLQKNGADKLDAYVVDQLHAFLQSTDQQQIPEEAVADAVLRIPVCYDLGLGNDLADMAVSLSLTIDEIITLHTGSIYQVYMLGFLPGFPYMGQVDEQIAIPRKSQPQPVKPGAVGIAGRQTGIYPTSSPGGWNIVGHTPLALFDPAATVPTLLQPGQWVQFSTIDLITYQNWPAL